LLPETTCEQSGDHATLKTVEVWPCRTGPGCPLVALHSRTVWSSLPETTCEPSGDHATLKTVDVWP
jgi:hypothetical protein